MSLEGSPPSKSGNTPIPGSPPSTTASHDLLRQMEVTTPSNDTTMAPSFITPSSDTTMVPSHDPSITSSSDTTMVPSHDPSSDTTMAPSHDPSITPSSDTTMAPSHDPSITPSSDTTMAPSHDPSITPSSDTTMAPSHDPSITPSNDTTMTPLQDSSDVTSEIFKIELINIPDRVGYQNLKKYLNSCDLNPGRIKQPGARPGVAYVNFRCEKDRKVALEVLNGRIWKKKSLIAKLAHPTPDPIFPRKRVISPQDTEAIEAKRAKMATMTLEERLNHAVTPLIDVPYQEQLQTKSNTMKEVLKKMAYRITHRDSHPGEWFTQHSRKHGGLACTLEPIKSSPILQGYRNKCEYTIGVCPSDGRVVVGFRLGTYEEGDFDVVSAELCCHIPERAKQLIKLFQCYLQQSSLPPFVSKTEEGYWRMLTLRCYGSGESMAIIHLHPQQLTGEDIAKEKAKLVEFFTSGQGAQAPPTSLYFQALGRLHANMDPSYEHLLGEKFVHESLLGLKFRISPPAFFQVNTPASEVLYSLIRDLAETEGVDHPIIYDICCGTGTIGLYLAKALSARKVVGIEMVKEAVEDARINAALNGVSNVEFVCGRAEDVVSDIHLPFSRRGEVIGVVDPPRAGLHSKVIQTIRKCHQIQKLIYVSCNPNGAMGNIVDLCRRKSNRTKGEPFCPVSATPVDLFPHTPHCELVILLERVTGKKPVVKETVAKDEKVVEKEVPEVEAELEKTEAKETVIEGKMGEEGEIDCPLPLKTS